MSKISNIIVALIIVFNSCQDIKDNDDLSSKSSYLDTTCAKLPILHLKGNPYEIGFQHGSLMKTRINKLISKWKKDIEEKYKISSEHFIKSFLDSTDYMASIKKWTPDLLDELKGISAGSEVDFETILTFQLMDEIWTNARVINFPHHCSSIGINNYKKNSGPNFIAQNIDIDPFYREFRVLLDIKDSRTESRKVVTTFTGYLGVNGFNKHIGVTENSLMDLKSSLKGLPVCFVSRGILNKKSFAEAVKFIKTIKHASGQNYLIGSREKILSLECAADLITEYWADTMKNYTFHANRALTNNSYHSAYIDYWQKNMGISPGSIEIKGQRFRILESRMKFNKTINIDTLANILGAKPVYNKNTFATTIIEFRDEYNEFRVFFENPDTSDFKVIKIKK